jgi:hypothetical protein
MAGNHHFRILTPDRSLSHDTFAVAPEQPETISADCLLVVDEMTGKRLTVHGTRLFPAGADGTPIMPEMPRSRCLECGQVSGVVEDQVSCPHGQDAGPCVFLAARSD